MAVQRLFAVQRLTLPLASPRFDPRSAFSVGYLAEPQLTYMSSFCSGALISCLLHYKSRTCGCIRLCTLPWTDVLYLFFQRSKQPSFLHALRRSTMFSCHLGIMYFITVKCGKDMLRHSQLCIRGFSLCKIILKYA